MLAFLIRLYFIVGFFIAFPALAQRVGSDIDDQLLKSRVNTEVNSSVSSAMDSLMSEQTWSAKGQATIVNQSHRGFRAKYSGDNSLTNDKSSKETFDATLYLGLKLSRGLEAYVNPEIDQGFGLSNTLGVAGYTSGEAYKVGQQNPYYRLPRAFLRQTIDLGGEIFQLDEQPNQLEKTITSNNLTLTLGKFSVVDIFDTNTYAHDPRSDFFNWSILDAGAFDYAADSWGFTHGAALEWNQDWWAIRAGYFALSTQPNKETIDASFKQNEWVAEFEEHHQVGVHPGKLKLLTYINHANMGLYSDALAMSALRGGSPDTSLVRKMNQKSGWALNIEQELTSSMGYFLKYSKSDGTKEAFDFTEINHSLATGILLKGNPWKRHNDSLGLAIVKNNISRDGQAYFAAGGMGILIGDGALNYASEEIIETFYNVVFNPTFNMALNYQNVKNPAYNKDRGPVNIFGVRFHVNF
jgi:high affinity Mn2+ porin